MVKYKPVKQEVSNSVILPPYGECALVTPFETSSLSESKARASWTTAAASSTAAKTTTPAKISWRLIWMQFPEDRIRTQESTITTQCSASCRRSRQRRKPMVIVARVNQSTWSVVVQHREIKRFAYLMLFAPLIQICCDLSLTNSLYQKKGQNWSEPVSQGLKVFGLTTLPTVTWDTVIHDPSSILLTSK